MFLLKLALCAHLIVLSILLLHIAHNKFVKKIEYGDYDFDEERPIIATVILLTAAPWIYFYAMVLHAVMYIIVNTKKHPK